MVVGDRPVSLADVTMIVSLTDMSLRDSTVVPFMTMKPIR